MILSVKSRIVSVCFLALGAASIAPRVHAATGPAATAFRDSVDTPPSGWKGSRFKLSHNYPAKLPVCDAPWLKRNVSFNDPNPNWEQWRGYVQDIIDYVKEGQDPNLNDNTGWHTEVNIKCVGITSRGWLTTASAAASSRTVLRMNCPLRYPHFTWGGEAEKSGFFERSAPVPVWIRYSKPGRWGCITRAERGHWVKCFPLPENPLCIRRTAEFLPMACHFPKAPLL